MFSSEREVESDSLRCVFSVRGAKLAAQRLLQEVRGGREQVLGEALHERGGGLLSAHEGSQQEVLLVGGQETRRGGQTHGALDFSSVFFTIS